jgi:Toprim domain-containing protein
MPPRLSPREIEERATALFGVGPNRRLSIADELRFGSRGSISVKLTGERAGLWYSHEEGKGGSLLHRAERVELTPRRVRGPTPSPSAAKFHEVVPRQLCGIDDPVAHVRSERFRDGDATPARRYLLSRGITRVPHSVCGWAGSGIAYIAQSADGAVLAVQVMHLHQDGTKNTDFWSDGVVKRTYCPMRDWHQFAAVRMPGRGGLILCEGPETGLSIWLATGRPVAACLGVAGMRSLRTGRRVTLAGDADEPGSAAARALDRAASERWDRGQKVSVVLPPYGDFNDIHRERGLAAVTALFEGKKNDSSGNSLEHSEQLSSPDSTRDNKR